jgi:hypothetical protein
MPIAGASRPTTASLALVRWTSGDPADRDYSVVIRLGRLPAVIAVGVAVAVVAVCAYAVARPLAFWTPDGRDLAESLQRSAGHQFAAYPCQRASGDRWRCTIEDDPGSGPSDRYALTLNRDGCWRGVRDGRDDDGKLWVPGGQPLRGCLQVLDFVWPR